jgi:hypothetical protein
MNKALYILLLFLFACHSSDDKTIAFLNEGIDRCNGLLMATNGNYLTDFEAFKAENPKRGTPIKVKCEIIKEKSENFIKVIEQKKARLSLDKLKYEQQPIDLDLFTILSEYIDKIDSLFPNDSTIQIKMKNDLNNKKVKTNAIDLTGLNLLKNKVQILNYFLYRKLHKELEQGFTNPNKYDVVVVPKKIHLSRLEKYEADIFLSAYDDKLNPIIIVGKDTLKIKNGKAIFIALKNDIIGNFEYSGNFVYHSRSDDEVRKFPFNINYRVVERP